MTFNIAEAELNLAWLYPEYLNLYGDQGNIICLQKRAEARHFRLNVHKISINDPFKPTDYDLVFMGGGQDQEQEALHTDFLQNKANDIRTYIANGGVMLTICGGYQLLGKYYQTQDGQITEGIDVLPIYTVAQSKRLIGNLEFIAEQLPLPKEAQHMFGFENHSGLTYFLTEKKEKMHAKAFGKVQKGHGNNGEDAYEGCHYLNCFGTYAHGSFLPKNPAFADYLLQLALQKKYHLTSDFSLEQLTEPLLANLRKQLGTLEA